MHPRKRRKGLPILPYLYVWPCATAYGYKYNGYSDSLNNPPGNAIGDATVNLKK